MEAANTIPSPAARAGPISTGRAGAWTVVFLGVTAGVQMSDRGLHSILSPAIQATFDVGDAVIGALHGIAGILVASALAVPLARLADRHSRKVILLCLIGFWALLTAVGALAPNFPLFFLGRAASGVTEFAMIPIVYSLIPDLVGDRHRVTANLTFAALMAIGASAGFYFGGALLTVADSIAPAGVETWRVALLLLAVAGVPLLLVGLSVKDPPRHACLQDDVAAITVADFLTAHRRRILLFLGTAGGLAIAVQAAIPMAPMALVRRFTADIGLIGHVLGIVTLVTSLGSLAMAGTIDRVLQSRLGDRSRPAIMAAGALLALPCLAVLAGTREQGTALAMIALFLAVTSTANALIPTMLQDILPTEIRARGFALYSFIIAAFCAVGPLMSGGISDRLVDGDLLLAIALAGLPALLVTAVCAGLMSWRRSG